MATSFRIPEMEEDQISRDSFKGIIDGLRQISYLAAGSNYLHHTQSDPDSNVVTHLFMAHPESVKLLHTYPWFISMYSTYKNNMSFFQIVGMTPCNKNFIIACAFMKDETEASYRWLLDKLRLMFLYGVEPKVIVTNLKLELMKPIAEIFPQSAHLLCTWHINKDVGQKVRAFCKKDMDFVEEFYISTWTNIIRARTKDDYNRAVEQMRPYMTNQPRIITYVSDTWLVHKEKFVPAWTNEVLHFGNTTICRVRSAYEQLKLWLNSSRGALNTVWMKVNQDIQSQLTQMRYTLEESRRKRSVHGSGFPFNRLPFSISMYCMVLLNDELCRMKELSTEVYDRCGCVLRNTHQIPCACEMRTAVSSKKPISLNRLHQFWRTLIIINDHAAKFNWVGSNDASKDQRTLVDEVNASDPTVVRNLSLHIHDQLHPDQASHNEPACSSLLSIHNAATTVKRVQKRSFNDEETYSIPLKQPRQVEYDNELVSFQEFVPTEVGSPRFHAQGESGRTENAIEHNGKLGRSLISSSNIGFNDEASYPRLPVYKSRRSEYFSASPHHSCREVTRHEDTYSLLLHYPPRKSVPIGSDHQADIPEWSSLNDDDDRLMGNCVIPMPELGSVNELENVKIECCCSDHGAISCVRQHIAEARDELERVLGKERFEELGFGVMGEQVASKWSEVEQQLFYEVVYSNSKSLGRNSWERLSVVFPCRTKEDTVSFYFNVFMLRRRAEQNRCKSNARIYDSDDDDLWKGSGDYGDIEITEYTKMIVNHSSNF